MAFGPTISVASKVDTEAPRVTMQWLFDGELDQLHPVDPAAIKNMVPHDRARFRHPNSFFEELSDYRSALLWGVHADIGKGPELIGICSLGNQETRLQEVGIALVKPEFQGRGIGPMVLSALVTYAFEQTPGDKIIATPRSCNVPVARALAKVGFYLANPGDAERSLWQLYRSPEAAVGHDPRNPGSALSFEAMYRELHPNLMRHAAESRAAFDAHQATLDISYSPHVMQLRNGFAA